MLNDYVNEWVSYVNKSYLNLSSPKIKIFKLDKTVTNIETLYVEEDTSRIYIPPFEMRAFMLTNPWKQMLGFEASSEEEDNVQFVVNFEDMVQKIRDLKNEKITDMYVTYNGTRIPGASKNEDDFTLYLDNVAFVNFNLNDINFNTTQKLATAINSMDYFSVELYGKNDSSVDLVDFELTNFESETLNVYSKEVYYDNITDVIEFGDLILTNKFRLYEVQGAKPSGDFAWNWVTYTLTCNLARIDLATLPEGYERQIKVHQYGVKNRISME